MEELSKGVIAVLTYPPNKTGWTKEDLNKYNLIIRSLRPNKGKKMNVTPNTTPVEQIDSLAQRPYYIDAEGNRVEIPFDTDSDGEAAQPVTAFIAEDGADHPVTVH